MLTPTRRAVYTRTELDRLLAPRSIAVVGASPRAASFGMRTLENLAHFKGAIYPVNAKYQEVAGHACYPSLAALPAKPDCVVLVVPRESVEESVKEA
ncbi:MAG: CoA-binding protein, partial [Burkholderiales bacterium]